MGLAAAYPLIIEQGSTFTLPLIISSSTGPRDLSGYSARGQIRKSYPATTTLAVFNISGSLDTSGSFAVTLTAGQTSQINSNGVYDIELYSGSYVERILSGSVTISPEVTR